MTELVDIDNALEPLSYSADGKRNSFTLACTPTGQSMNYAACIWRQNVLAKPNVNTPPDWSVCRQARNEGRCTALLMREEEELAGKSIYFRCRSALSAASAAAREWIMPKGAATSVPIERARRPSSAPSAVTARPASMLDAMAGMGDLSDAVSAAARAETLKRLAPAPAPAPAHRAPALVAALPGESPLQMARRLHAERQIQPQH